jgi:glycosyltransferase involved in cell wall biosynthesis
MVLIPALNEAASVAQVVSFWKQLGARTVRVVDNGSTDGTGDLARAAGDEVVTEATRGYGVAAWRGLQETPDGIEWILFSSADGSDRLTAKDLSDWQRHADEGFELILGDRMAAKNARVRLTPVQRFGNRLACLLIFFGWRRRFNDLGSLRLIKRRALDRLNLRDRAFGWNVEMQVRAIEHGLRIIELPVGYYPRAGGRSKISGSLPGALRAGRDILLMLARLWWARRFHALG